MAKAKSEEARQRPPQEQDQQPGVESEMRPRPESDNPNYRGSGKLKGRIALITGGDSGIGKAVAIAFAKEGADLYIVYLNEENDAQGTKDILENQSANVILKRGDVSDPDFCQEAIEDCVERLGGLDVLVNNAAEQHVQPSLTDISNEQFEQTFRTNLFSVFYLCKYALPHLHKGATIINTASVTAYRGSPGLIDYSSTKGAIVAFTRSLSLSLADKGIRVNAVAPGPVWTPLIPASFDAKDVATFGSDVPLGRAGHPYEMAPAFVYLACEDSSYVNGQVIHPNGGEIING